MSAAAACERCGQDFEARRRSARFCSARCQKAAARRRRSEAVPSTAAPRVFTRGQVIAELDAMLELIPADVAVLESRFPPGDDPEVDDVVDGLWLSVEAVELIRNYIARKES